MTYNSQRNPLVIREYGRNVQKLIEHATTIKNKEERNNMVKEIINLMGQMNPAYRNIEEFRHKLWDHLFMISDFKLEADSPYPVPDKKVLKSKPKRLPYAQHNLKFKHYGRNVELMIEKAMKMKDTEKQKAFVEIIGNYMKMVYRNWNKENVNDEMIKNDLEMMSKGELTITSDFNLDSLSSSQRSRPRPGNGRDRDSRDSRDRNRSGGRDRSNYKRRDSRDHRDNRRPR